MNRREIRRIAQRVRNTVCDIEVERKCGPVSFYISEELAKENIPHKLVRGKWLGDVDPLEVFELYDEEDDRHMTSAEVLELDALARRHAWIEINGEILDATADQFDLGPQVRFPADQSQYRKMEVYRQWPPSARDQEEGRWSKKRVSPKHWTKDRTIFQRRPVRGYKRRLSRYAY